VLFGRLKGAWGVAAGVYRLHHSQFDLDIDNCILLTNELINKTPLQAEDQKFYLAGIEKHLELMEMKKEKKRKTREKSKENQQKRIKMLLETK